MKGKEFVSEITVTLPDGSQGKYPAGITASEVALKISSRLAKAGRIGGFPVVRRH